VSEGAGRNDDRIGGGKKRATRRARERGAWILDFGKEKKIASFKTQTPRAPASSRASSSLAGDARAARRSRGSTRPRVASRRASIDVLAEDAPGVRREALARGASRLLPRRRERLGRPDARGADAHARAPSGDAPRGGRGVRRARGAPVRARARGPRPRHGRGLARAPVARRGDARTTPLDTAFQNPSSTSAKNPRRDFIRKETSPGPGLRSRSLPPLLPQDERELADASCDAFHASASASRLAADASAAARRGSPITRGASASLRKRRDALAAADAARARLAVATARRRALRDAVDAADARRAAYDDRDYARDALRRAVREESEATGRTPLPRGAREREVANDGGDGAREARSADASPRSAGSSPEEAPAAKRAMTTAGEDEAAGEVDGLAEAFAAAACIR